MVYLLHSLLYSLFFCIFVLVHFQLVASSLWFRGPSSICELTDPFDLVFVFLRPSLRRFLDCITCVCLYYIYRHCYPSSLWVRCSSVRLLVVPMSDNYLYVYMYQRKKHPNGKHIISKCLASTRGQFLYGRVKDIINIITQAVMTLLEKNKKWARLEWQPTRAREWGSHSLLVQAHPGSEIYSCSGRPSSTIINCLSREIHLKSSW